MIHNVIKENAYFDSVTLMVFSSKLNTIDGIIEAAVMMGTDHNIDLMSNSGILTAEVAAKLTSNDLVIGINAESQSVIDEALKVLDEQFENKNKKSKSSDVTAKTVQGAINAKPDTNFAVISVPGRFAKREVTSCLKNGVHVLLFSDNVSLEEEIQLKELAEENDLLMMGPDCGTAIINGVALGFANVVKRGNIGLVAASGTGLQEVSVLVDLFGGGISQALGTGGRDVKEAVGGKMMLKGLDALNADDSTAVIGIVSKPPSAVVMKKILDRVETFKKPVVACFLGGDKATLENSSIYAAYTLENAAQYLVDLAQDKEPTEVTAVTKEQVTPLSSNNTGSYIRGLYTGGTLAYETMLLLNESIGNVYSNIAMDKEYTLENPDLSVKNTVVDMGEDYFTDGMAHPMIDPRLRNERIQKEVADPETAVVLLDCVLGYGSHEDPAGEIATAITQANKSLTNREVTYVASVTGTETDPQVRSSQIKTLESVGVVVLPTNAQAAQYAALLMQTKGGQK
jgi:FdrA protein